MEGVTHAKCKTKYSLDGVVAMWRYRGVLTKAIGQMKYKFVSDMAGEVVELAEENLKQLLPHPGVLVPVPLHRRRWRWRGFNQAEIIGEKLASKWELGFEPEWLVRRKFKRPQVGLTEEERRKNVKGGFEVNELVLKDKGVDAILFDDVWTTGATMKEAARALKRAGVKRVWGVVLAR